MDLRALDKRALNDVRKLVNSLPAAQMARATPCVGWTVRDLIDHMNREHEAISEPILDTPVRLDHDTKVAFDQATDRWLSAFAPDEVLDQDILVPKHHRRYPCRQVLAIHVVDMVVHRWDLAKAIGADPDLPADLVGAALPIAQAIPAEGPLRGPGRAYAEPVPADADATATDRLVAALGRSPTWTAHD